MHFLIKDALHLLMPAKSLWSGWGFRIQSPMCCGLGIKSTLNKVFAKHCDFVFLQDSQHLDNVSESMWFNTEKKLTVTVQP